MNFSMLFTDCQRRHVEKMLNQVKSLELLPTEHISNTVEMLRRIKFKRNDIIAYPKLLKSPASQLKSRYEILREIGFDHVSSYQMMRFKWIYTGTIEYSRSFYCLPRHIDVVKSMIRVAQLPIADAIDEIPRNPSDTIETIQRSILEVYLKKRLQITDTQPYHLQQRSLQSIEQTIRMVEDNFDGGFEYTSTGIIQYTPDEMKQLLDLKYVCGVDIRRIIASGHAQHHRFTMERCEWIEDIFQRYGVPDYSVCCLNFIMIRGRDTIERHFERIARLDGGRRFLRHPFVTRLVGDMTKFERHAIQNGVDFDTMFNDRFVE